MCSKNKAPSCPLLQIVLQEDEYHLYNKLGNVHGHEIIPRFIFAKDNHLYTQKSETEM